MIATEVFVTIVKWGEDTQTPARCLCRKETRFIQYQQKYGHDCVCMEKKRVESMDVNNTYMTLNTENNVHTDGRYHRN